MQSDQLDGEQRPVNWRIGKDQYGKIRRNQMWRKRDTGKIMVIVGPAAQNTWHVRFEGDSRTMRSHKIKERDIYRFYMLCEERG